MEVKVRGNKVLFVINSGEQIIIDNDTIEKINRENDTKIKELIFINNLLDDEINYTVRIEDIHVDKISVQDCWQMWLTNVTCEDVKMSSQELKFSGIYVENCNITTLRLHGARLYVDQSNEKYRINKIIFEDGKINSINLLQLYDKHIPIKVIGDNVSMQCLHYEEDGKETDHMKYLEYLDFDKMPGINFVLHLPKSDVVNDNIKKRIDYLKKKMDTEFDRDIKQILNHFKIAA